MAKVVLITGATGKQGGAVINSLLASPEAKNITILAVTRNPESVSAKKLADKGCKLVVGDMDDIPAIFEAAKKVCSEPVWGVFSVQLPHGKGNSGDAEEKQGKDLVDGAIANGVKMFVYSSVERGGETKSFDNPTPVPHFITKHNIEHYLVEKAEGKMDWTILRPVAFMDNLTPDFMGKGFATMWKVALKDRPLQLIAVSDIGHFAAQAFIKPDEYKGKQYSLAGDELTYEQLCQVFESKTGTELPTTFGFFAHGIMWAVADVGKMFQWFYTDGYKSDIKKLKQIHPGLLSFGQWLEKGSKFETK